VFYIHIWWTCVNSLGSSLINHASTIEFYKVRCFDNMFNNVHRMKRFKFFSRKAGWYLTCNPSKFLMCSLLVKMRMQLRCLMSFFPPYWLAFFNIFKFGHLNASQYFNVSRYSLQMIFKVQLSKYKKPKGKIKVWIWILFSVFTFSYYFRFY
jgi:hypothetical protein